MKQVTVERIIPLATAVACIIALVLWLKGSEATELQMRVPDEREIIIEAVSPGSQGKLETFDGKAAKIEGSWPRFRGKNADGISDEMTYLAKEWPDAGPEELWSIEVGEGHAGAAVLAGRVYVMDYDRGQAADVVRCLSLADGKDIWRYSYPVKVKRNHGMSRTVPAVTEKYVVTIGPKCHVTCLDAVSGERKWFIDLVRDYNTKVPPWYAGQCPLIDNGRAILAPGGDALMIAVDCESGKVLWKTPNPDAWKMTHVSVVVMTFPPRRAGKERRMYVYCGSGGVVGISADDGVVLWKTTEWRIRIAAVASPVVAGEDRLFLSGGYNAGSMMLEIEEKEGVYSAKPVFRLKQSVYGSPQHTPILYNEHIYGVRPDQELVCLNLDGKLIWRSSPQDRFGLGPYMIADNMIFVMNDSGLLTLAEASSSGYRRVARAQVLKGHDSWGPMAIADGRLILRDLTRMICLDVRRKADGDER